MHIQDLQSEIQVMEDKNRQQQDEFKVNKNPVIERLNCLFVFIEAQT